MTHSGHRNPVQVRRAYKFRAYLTRPQEGRAVRLLADHCDLYNAALEERREAWRMRKGSVSYGMQSAQLTDIRAADPGGQGRHSFTAQQQTLRRLSTVFAAFYERAKAGRAGYPRFKAYSRFGQVRFVAGDGAKWTPAPAGGWARAQFQAVGSVKVRQHRTVPGTVKALQLKREHRRWYAIVITETQPVPLAAAGREVGADVGVARFLTTSDGQIVANPRFLAASAALITGLQRRTARSRPGSGNRKRLRRALAKEWRKTRNRRRDFHQKPLSSAIRVVLKIGASLAYTHRPSGSWRSTEPSGSNAMATVKSSASRRPAWSATRLRAHPAYRDPSAFTSVHCTDATPGT